MTTQAVLYIRISKDRDNQHSTDNQIREGKAYAASRGWEVVAVVTDLGLSAFKKGKIRPGFNEAKQMIHSGQAQVLLVWKLDRLARRVNEGIRVKLELEDAGGQIASVKEPIDMLSMGQDWQAFIMFLTFAEAESHSKADRAKSFNDGRRLEGLPPCGPRPYGYKRTKGSLLVNEDEALVIKQFAASMLDGGTIKGFIRKHQPRGTQGGIMTPQAFRNIFNSATVTGHRQDGGQLLQGNWPAILDVSTWEAVRAVLADPVRRTSSSTQVKHMLTGKGIMTCGACNHDQMSVRTWKQNATSTKKAARGYRYTCTSCGNNSGWQDAIDAKVTEVVLGAIDQEAWQELLSQGSGVNAAEVQKLQQEAEELTMAALNPSPAFRGFTVASIQPRLDAIDAELEIAMGQKSLDLPKVKNLAKAWPTMDALDKRRVLAVVTTSIVLEPANGRRNPAARVKVQLAS